MKDMGLNNSFANRNFIGIEKDEAYFKIAEQRIKQTYIKKQTK